MSAFRTHAHMHTHKSTIGTIPHRQIPPTPPVSRRFFLPATACLPPAGWPSVRYIACLGLGSEPQHWSKKLNSELGRRASWKAVASAGLAAWTGASGWQLDGLLFRRSSCGTAKASKGQKLQGPAWSPGRPGCPSGCGPGPGGFLSDELRRVPSGMQGRGIGDCQWGLGVRGGGGGGGGRRRYGEFVGCIF